MKTDPCFPIPRSRGLSYSPGCRIAPCSRFLSCGRLLREALADGQKFFPVGHYLFQVALIRLPQEDLLG